MTLRIGSLCSGYGGLDLAVHEVLGGELAWVADNDPGASAILAHRFPGVPNLGDIAATRWESVEPVDLLAAGFPCQDVSCAGARRGLRQGNRTGVWTYAAEAIAGLRPPLVLLENVRGLLTFGADSNLELCPWCVGDSGDESVLRACGAVLADLADLGFDAEWVLVSAAEAGAPHRRERVFILAWPAADAGSERRERWPGLGGTGWPATIGQQAGSDGRYGSFTPAPHADCTASGERRITAPGEAEGRGSRADAGGRGGAPAADAAGIRARLSEQDRKGDLARGGGEERLGAGREAWPAANPERGGRDRGSPLQVRGQAERTSPAGHSRGADIDWGTFESAIRRWDHATGRPAPRPTEPGRTGERLSPRFVEWMMGLPEGWVTDVPGLSRNAQLKALGNGVVPQQAAMALRLLLDRSGLSLLAAESAA